MAVLKVKSDPNDPNSPWLDIAGTGAQGPSGGPVPVGGLPGEVIVKTGPADMEVGWTGIPRAAFKETVPQVVSHATINTFVDAVAGSATIDPSRNYLITAGIRCIADPGARCVAQAQVGIGTVNLEGFDVWSVHGDTDGLWGAWSQTWVESGDRFVAAGDPPAAVDVRLRIMLGVASKTIYSPRLFIVELF